MIKKEIAIGILTGILANSIGIFIAVLICQKYADLGNISQAFSSIYKQGTLGALIALGAILNMLCFFTFLKKRNIYRARGVLIATMIAAIYMMIYKFL